MEPRIYLDDEDFDDVVKRHMVRRIDEQLRSYLTHQLKGVIEARVANLRLNDPDSKPVGEAIEEVLGKKIDEHLRKALPDLVDAHLRIKLRKLFDTV